MGRGRPLLESRPSSATPGSAAAHNNLAVAYEKQGAWEEARREYEEALRLAPGDLAIKENYEAFLARLASGRGRRRMRTSAPASFSSPLLAVGASCRSSRTPRGPGEPCRAFRPFPPAPSPRSS